MSDEVQQRIFSLSVPVMTQSQFATMVGLTVDTVRGMVDHAHLPSVKVGRYRMINLVLLTEEMLTEVWEK